MWQSMCTACPCHKCKGDFGCSPFSTYNPIRISTTPCQAPGMAKLMCHGHNLLHVQQLVDSEFFGTQANTGIKSLGNAGTLKRRKLGQPPPIGAFCRLQPQVKPEFSASQKYASLPRVLRHDDTEQLSCSEITTEICMTRTKQLCSRQFHCCSSQHGNTPCFLVAVKETAEPSKQPESLHTNPSRRSPACPSHHLL